MMTADAAALLALARVWCAARAGVTLRGLGERAGHDKLFIRLAAGKGCKPETVARVLAWLAVNWPSDLAWPAGVTRPQAPVVEAVEPAEEEAMGLAHEEDSEVEAERLAEEKAHALFLQRLHAAERRAAAARRQEAERIREAQALLERADPWLLAEERYKAAVRNVPLYDSLSPPPGPSFAGQSPHHTTQLEAAEASMARQAAADRALAERVAADRAAIVETLAAGQAPEQAAWVRRTAKVGGT